MILYFVKFIGSDNETPIYGPFSTYDKAESWMLQQIEYEKPVAIQRLINGTLYTLLPHGHSVKAIRYNWEIVAAELDAGKEII